MTGGDSIEVLLIEDNVDLRSYISRMLRHLGYSVSTAVDGLEGWQYVQAHLPDIVVSDIMMPGMDGYELACKIKSAEETRGIPVILITAKPELESKLAGLELGADDYLRKPINIRELDARIRNLVTARRYQQPLSREAALSIRIEELSKSFSRSLELRHTEAPEHSTELVKLGSLIADAIGLPTDWKFTASMLLHDIGKIGIPDSILKKPTALSEEEWEIMKEHPEYGAKLLGQHGTHREVSEIILAHHERFDGTGYPRGLKGPEIPVIARIIAIAGAFHVMTNSQPYRAALAPREAVKELIRNRGTQFDPKLVDVFIQGLVQLRIINKNDL